MQHVYYALGLHMHQPPHNLRLLIESNEWEAQQIMRCYDRAARYAHLYKDVAFFHVGFSGILLEQFQDPVIIDAYRKYVDIPQMLENYRTAKNIEIIGMGHFHPIFPLIPKDDWKDHLAHGQSMIQKIFGQKPKGFWPPEMAFCMEMIPAIRQAGYEYVVVDHVHVVPVKPAVKIDYFKPYIATYDDASLTIIPRNRDISNAQESGMSAAWFENEVDRTLGEYPATHKARLVTTWSDGENGGWFRQMDERSGFFGHFFAPLMEDIVTGETKIRPIKISDFIKKYPASESATVRTGAWNVASTSGYDFSQWNGSGSQKKALQELFNVSRMYWELRKQNPSNDTLKQAHRFILDAETSCYLFWGDAWIPKLYEKLAAAKALMESV